MHDAAINGHVQVLYALADAGVDLNSRTKNGETPYEIAKRFGRDDFCKAINDINAQRSKKGYSSNARLFDHPHLAKNDKQLPPQENTSCHII